MNETALEWLRYNSEQAWDFDLDLHFAPGVVYVEDIGALPAEKLLPTVELFLGYLDRIPAQAWYPAPHQPMASHQGAQRPS